MAELTNEQKEKIANNRKQNTIKYKKEHEFEMSMDSNDAKPFFKLKFNYYEQSLGTRCISMFQDEITKETYMVLTNNEYIKDDEHLYKFNPRDDYETHYQSSKTANGQIRYIVPIDELEDITAKYIAEKDKPQKKTTTKKASQTPQPKVNELSVTDWCAIIWKQPIADSIFVNNLIKSTFKNN